MWPSVKIEPPSGAKATARTGDSCPRRQDRSAPVLASQSLTVASVEPVATVAVGRECHAQHRTRVAAEGGQSGPGGRIPAAGGRVQRAGAQHPTVPREGEARDAALVAGEVGTLAQSSDSQTRILPSDDPAATWRPSGEAATPVIPRPRPARRGISTPVRASHTRTDPSSDPETISRPPAEDATPVTGPDVPGRAGPGRPPASPRAASESGPRPARRPDLLRPAPSLEEVRDPRAGCRAGRASPGRPRGRRAECAEASGRSYHHPRFQRHWNRVVGCRR